VSSDAATLRRCTCGHPLLLPLLKQPAAAEAALLPRRRCRGYADGAVHSQFAD